MSFLRQYILAEGKGKLNLGSTLFSKTQRNFGVEIQFYLEILTRKPQEKMHLKMLSAKVVCCK